MFYLNYILTGDTDTFTQKLIINDQIIKTKIQNTSKKYIPKKQRKLNNVSSINNE